LKYAIMVVLVVTVLFCSCENSNTVSSGMSDQSVDSSLSVFSEETSYPEVSSEWTEVSSETESRSYEIHIPSGLEYVPGIYALSPRDEGGFTGFLPVDRKYRERYYNTPGPYCEMTPEGTFDEFAKYYDANFGKPSYNLPDMFMAGYVKYFNIPKSEFLKASEEYRKEIIKSMEISYFDPNQEYYEVLNADVIYTFDNDLINEYYRYR